MNYAQGFGLNLGSYASNYGSSLGNLGSYANNYGSSLGNIGSYANNYGSSLGNIGNLGSNLGSNAVKQGLGSYASNYGSNLGSNALSKASKANFFEKYGGITLQGIGTGIQLYSAINQGINNAKMITAANKQLELAQNQFDEETNRYNAREKERLDANKQVAQSASLYDNPMTRT